jgi:sulfate permease, SulP family
MWRNQPERGCPHRPIPLLQGILPFDTARIGPDVVAGLTLAAVGIPQAMGYAKIIGVPVVLGLYTLLLPVLAFALFGSSRHLVVAADSATAAMVASALISASSPAGSPRYISLTGLVALVSAGLLLLARLFRMGFLADFLSRTVLVGFLTGVGLQVASAQLHAMLGLEKGGRGLFGALSFCFERVHDIHGASLLISVCVLAFVASLARLAPRVPGALLAVVGAIAVSAIFHLGDLGVLLVGQVPGGLPALKAPDVAWGDVPHVIEVAFSCFIVILAQSAATSRAYATRYREEFSANGDLVGLCLANVAAAFTGTFIVNGSPTQTATVDAAGGRSQLAHAVTAATMVPVLLFLTGYLSDLPEAALASIVFYIGIRLIKVASLVEVFKKSRDEFWIALITAGTVVAVGVREGILLALVLSLLEHVRRGYRPPTGVILRDSKDHVRMEPAAPGQMIEPGLVLYWFGGELYYANASFFAEQARSLAVRSQPPVRWLVVSAGAIPNVDYSAAEAIRELQQDLAKEGTVLAMAFVSPSLREDLDRHGLTDRIGAGHLFDTVHDCLQAYLASDGAAR